VGVLYVWTNKTKYKNQHGALGGTFYNAQFDWLFQNSGVRTKIGQVDPEPRLSIAKRMALLNIFYLIFYCRFPFIDDSYNYIVIEIYS